MKALLRMMSGVFGKKAPAKAEKKYASAYRFGDRIVLHSQLQTPFGQFAAEPFLRLDLKAPAEAVAVAVREVLEASRRAPDTPHGKGFGKWYLEQMGVKSLAALQRGTLSVGMAMAEGMIEFSATHNGGSSGDGKGFQPIDGAVVTVAAGASAGEIAGALGRAFELCTRVG